MSGEQIVKSRLSCLESTADRANDQAVNSRLLVRQQKMYGSQKWCGELAEMTVDDIWQIADAGDQNFTVV